MIELMRLTTDWLFITSQYTLATASLFAAVVFYIYSLLDRRIPSLIVPVVVGVLIYFGSYTYGNLNGTEQEKLACDTRMNAARQELLDRYGKATLTLRYIERQYEDSKRDTATKQREYQEELDELLLALQQEREDNAKVETDEIPTISTKSCLDTPIPDSIVRNLNKTRG